MGVAEILLECARLASGAGAGALASVGKRRGSLPMSASAKMLVTAGGARLGTVGGGCLEAEITEKALDVLERREPSVSEHSLNAELAGDYGLTCGGTAVMVIEPVYPNQVLSAIYAEAAAVMARGERAVLVTDTNWQDGPSKLLVTKGGSVGSSQLSSLALSLGADTEAPEMRDGVLIEPITGAPRLVVFGGGHVGRSVAEAAAFAGWRVTVVDDREEFADLSRLPFAERAVCCDFRGVVPAVGIVANDYCVIATRGHQHDALIAEQLAPIGLRYLGMLGSRRKVALTRSLLEKWGVAAGHLDVMRAPVGLPIGADTPAEIAVSVVAEMIAERRRGSRRRGGDDILSACQSSSTT